MLRNQRFPEAKGPSQPVEERVLPAASSQQQIQSVQRRGLAQTQRERVLLAASSQQQIQRVQKRGLAQTQRELLLANRGFGKSSCPDVQTDLSFLIQAPDSLAELDLVKRFWFPKRSPNIS